MVDPKDPKMIPKKENLQKFPFFLRFKAVFAYFLVALHEVKRDYYSLFFSIHTI